MIRVCLNCRYWKKDWGIHCMIGGWTGADKDEGHCHFERTVICKMGDDFCHYWESKDD